MGASINCNVIYKMKHNVLHTIKLKNSCFRNCTNQLTTEHRLVEEGLDQSSLGWRVDFFLGDTLECFHPPVELILAYPDVLLEEWEKSIPW